MSDVSYLPKLSRPLSEEACADPPDAGRSPPPRVPPARLHANDVPPPLHGPLAPASGSRLRLLVLDDEEAMRTILCRILTEYEVVAVSDGRPALDLLRSGKRFDLILSDLMMPGMSGQCFYEAVLREHPDEANKIVFLTAGAINAETERFLDGLLTPRIPKPFQAQRLRATLDTLVAARASRR